MVILRMNNSICEGQDGAEFLFQLNLQLEVFREIEILIPPHLHIHLRSHHAGMALACGAGEVRLDL